MCATMPFFACIVGPTLLIVSCHTPLPGHIIYREFSERFIIELGQILTMIFGHMQP